MESFVGNTVIPSIETLTGGTADTFVVCAGAGSVVSQLTAEQVLTLLSVLTSAQIAAAYQPLGSYAASSHTHGNITSAGAIGSSASLPVITGASGVLQAGSFGSSSGTFCQGNDSRLSDSRTPTSHVHGNITDAGAIGSTATLPVITGASGVLTVGSFGTSAGTFCQGNDSRITGLGTMATKSTYVIQIALSGYDTAVSAGTKKGQCRVPLAGTITGFAITCDPANEPSAAAIQCDLNTVNLSTGALTTCLTSVASIATGANVSTGGAISGSPSVSAGDQLAVDIDQGSDGKGLLATITITAT